LIEYISFSDMPIYLLKEYPNDNPTNYSNLTNLLLSEIHYCPNVADITAYKPLDLSN
jgi:hypothetical protein